MGILMITHDLSTAAHFADRIAVMYLGRIVEEGPAQEVVRNPQHPYTEALISVVPKRDPREQTEPQILQGETPNPVHVPSGCRFHPRCPIAEERVPADRPQPAAAGGANVPEHRAACIVTAPGPRPTRWGRTGAAPSSLPPRAGAVGAGAERLVASRVGALDRRFGGAGRRSRAGRRAGAACRGASAVPCSGWASAWCCSRRSTSPSLTAAPGRRSESARSGSRCAMCAAAGRSAIPGRSCAGWHSRCSRC